MSLKTTIFALGHLEGENLANIEVIVKLEYSAYFLLKSL